MPYDNNLRTMLFMRCASDHAVWRHQDNKPTGATVIDLEENPEQQYEATGNSTMSNVLLVVLVAVVCLIGGLAAWTSA
jgi:hypothetical protein